MKLSRQALKVAGACLVVSGLLTACTGPTPEPTPSPVASPSEDELVGDWQSKTTDDVILSIRADGTFGVAGLCAVSGKWKIDGSDIAAASDSIPDIGGCADTFVVNRETISSIVLLENGELQLVDEDGERDSFKKVL